VTPGQEEPKWTPRQRAGLALGTTLAATLVLYIVLSMIHNTKTVEGRQLSYQQDLVAMGVENVQQSDEDNLFHGEVGTCSFIIEIKNDLRPIRAVFYLDGGERSLLDPPFATPALDGETFIPDAPAFDEC